MFISKESKLHTTRLYNAIGRPLDAIPSVLVGGTNGKVFVCVICHAFFASY